jgi:hypothetical protein
VFYTIQDENRLRGGQPHVQHVVVLSPLIVFSSFMVSQVLIARICLKEQTFYEMGEGGGGGTLKRRLQCVQNTSMEGFSSKKKRRKGKVHLALSVLLSNSRLNVMF